jgi:phosphonopyruvate decarboxylase
MRCAAALVGDAPCVVSIGQTWSQWNTVRPGDGNIQVKTLGLGASIGLGLALAMEDRNIVVLDGDGAVLMNLNGLVTVGLTQPKNLIHVVFDNKVYEASGGTPSASAFNASLTGLARGAGIRSAHEVHDAAAFEAALKDALASDGPHFIAAIIAASMDSGEHARLDEVENRYRFIRYLERLEGRDMYEYPADIRPKST